MPSVKFLVEVDYTPVGNPTGVEVETVLRDALTEGLHGTGGPTYGPTDFFIVDQFTVEPLVATNPDNNPSTDPS